MNRTVKTMLLAFIVMTVLFTPVLNWKGFAAENDGNDFPVYGGDVNRSRYISDDKLKPPIQLKGRLSLGWSVSQTIAVGDFFYAVAAVSDNQNLYNLSPGIYLYKIPVDFDFIQGDMTRTQIVTMLNSKGAQVKKLSNTFRKTYSHPTYSPETKKFYIGFRSSGGDTIIALDENLNNLRAFSVPTGDAIVGPPTVLSGDLVATGAYDGKMYIIQGLASKGGYSYTSFTASSESNAEISGAVTQINDTDFVFGYNLRGSNSPTKVYRLRAYLHNGKPWINKVWERQVSRGVPSNFVYEKDRDFLIGTTKGGHLYKLRGLDGHQYFMKKVSGVTLINNSPAVDDNNIYVPVRNPGKIVAYNKTSGTQVFTAAQGKEKNGRTVDDNIKTGQHVANDMTVWKNGDHKTIFYGDTAGQLIFLKQDGTRDAVAVDYEKSNLTRSSIKGPLDTTVPSNWQVQGQGVSTEPLLAKNHLVFGINDQDDNSGSLWFYSVGQAEDLYVDSVQGGTYQKGENVLTPVVVGSKEPTKKPLNAVVRLYRDSTLIGERTVHIKPNQKQTVVFSWMAGAPKKGALKATINIPAKIPEIDFENNTKTAPYIIEDGTAPEKNLCTPPENKPSGVTKVVTVCDDYGCSTIYYYEYLVEQSTPSYPSKIRAGYGFSFESYSLYIDEASQYSGPKKTMATFEGMDVNYVDKIVKMEKTQSTGPSYNELSKWELPIMYVEKYSGNLFYDVNHPKRDQADELLNGGRKWYTNFLEKDKLLHYKVVSSQAGKNNLSSCNTYVVEIKGSPYDDYVRRDVHPSKPFVDPKGKGFNWDGKDSSITDLKPFYEGKDNTFEGDQKLDAENVDKLKEEEDKEYSKKSAKDFNGS